MNSRSRHYLLSVVCLVTLSTNLLAVSLSGILEQRPVHITRPLNGTFKNLPEFINLPTNASYSDHHYAAVANLREKTPLPRWTDHDRYYLPFTYGNLREGSLEGGSTLFQNIAGPTTGIAANISCVEYSSNQNNDNTILFKSYNETNGPRIDYLLAVTTSHRLSDGTRVGCRLDPISAVHVDTPAVNGMRPPVAPNNSYAMEIVRLMKPINGVDDKGFCSSQTFLGWLRLTIDQSNEISDKFSATVIGCHTNLISSSFEVTVGLEGQVLDSRATNKSTNGNAWLEDSEMAKNLKERTNSMYGWAGMGWHNTTYTSDWTNALLDLGLNSKRLVDPNLPVPNPGEVIPLIQKLHQYTFAIILGLNPDIFAQSQRNDTIFLNANTNETRLFVDPLMFKISTVLLVIQLIVAVLYYSNRPRRYLPRMPTNIASIIAFVSASRALGDFLDDNEGTKWKHREAGSDSRYGYGRFVGTDGKIYVGIEKQQFVVPLKSRNPEVKRRRLGWRRSDEKEVTTWI